MDYTEESLYTIFIQIQDRFFCTPKNHAEGENLILELKSKLEPLPALGWVACVAREGSFYVGSIGEDCSGEWEFG